MVIDVLVNDFDMDGDALTVVSTTNPINGQVQINPDSTVTYTPNIDFVGEDSECPLIVFVFYILFRTAI